MVTAENIEGPRGNADEVPVRRFPITHVHNGFAFETHKVTRANMWELRHRAFPFEQILGYDVFRTPDEIRHHIQPRPGRLVEVVFARTIRLHSKDVGVVTQELVDVSVAEQKRRVLSIGVKAVSPEFQNRDIGTLLLEDTLLEHDGIDVVTGKSRNPRVFRYLEKTPLIKRIFGFDEDFTDEVVETLALALDKTAFKQITDLRRGLCIGIYPPADSRLFIASKNNEVAERIVAKLRERGVEPGGVNGLRYFAEVDKEAVEAAKSSYVMTETLGSVTSRYPLESLGKILAGLFKLPQQLQRGRVPF